MSIKTECLICIARNITPTHTPLYRDGFGYQYCELHANFAARSMVEFNRTHPIAALKSDSLVNKFKAVIGYAQCGCGDCWFCILNGGWGKEWQRRAEAKANVLLP